MADKNYIYMSEILYYASKGVQQEVKEWTDVLNRPEPREYPATVKEEEAIRKFIDQCVLKRNLIDRISDLCLENNMSPCFVIEKGWLGDEVHVRFRRSSNDG